MTKSVGWWTDNKSNVLSVGPLIVRWCSAGNLLLCFIFLNIIQGDLVWMGKFQGGDCNYLIEQKTFHKVYLWPGTDWRIAENECTQIFSEYLFAFKSDDYPPNARK